MAETGGEARPPPPYNGLKSRLIRNQDDSKRLWILLSFVSFLVFGGVVWWETTFAPTGTLPKHEISLMNDTLEQLKTRTHVIKVNLWTISDETINGAVTSQIQNNLKLLLGRMVEIGIPVIRRKTDSSIEINENVRLKAQVTVKSLKANEQVKKDIREQFAIHDLYNVVKKKFGKELPVDSSETYNLIIIDSSLAPEKLLKEEYEPKTMSSTTRDILHVSGDKRIEEMILSSDIDDSIVANILAVAFETYYHKASINQKDDMMRKDRSYMINFSLLIADPSDLIVTWKIEKSFTRFFLPFLAKISHLADFQVNFQLKYFAHSAINLQYSSINSYESGYPLTSLQMETFLNNLGINLDASIKVNQPIHFVVYVPEQKQSPMKLLDKYQRSSLYPETIFYPGWGGVSIHNIDYYALEEKQSLLELNEEELADHFRTFVAHLRKLFGVHTTFNQESNNPSKWSWSSGVEFGITGFEEDRLFWQWRLDFLESTIATLCSFDRLSQNQILPSITITPQVINEYVKPAIESWRRALEHYDSDLIGSLLNAQKAFNLAEQAFFHSSVLGDPYFPDEHKFAVYVPLFLPLFLPVLIALIHLLKERRETRQSKQETEAGQEKDDEGEQVKED